ncbi:MAG TPA: hypothetical protein VHT73_10820 [Thermodesulfobacteriota bacterium]|nr:hypothetical protein [Thermodesulfobacteriota bacterium]
MSQLEVLGPIHPKRGELIFNRQQDGVLELEWLGFRYSLSNQGRPFTENEERLLKGIGNVLSTRYQILFNADLAARNFHLFSGLPEDRYVSAFLDPSHIRRETLTRSTDRIEDAIEVLRISSLTTYENRRIETGVLLFGSQPDPCHSLPQLPPGTLRYSSALTSIRAFHRLCDALQTMALVDRDGLLVEIVDIQEWTQPFGNFKLSVPSTARYDPHSRATMCGGHICLILTPNGEIKIFADGMQVFNFLGGRWRLTDPLEKYSVWEKAVGNKQMAERLFSVALNLAEDRRGGMFVILNDAQIANRMIAYSDLLSSQSISSDTSKFGSKDQLHYLLRQKSVLNLSPTVLETLARIDGAIVLDRESNLLAFGAILRHPLGIDERIHAVEGGRTTAAIFASRFGNVLKVSEDGFISFFQDGQDIWEM